MRNKEQSLAIAERLLEAYRNSPTYYKTHRGHYKARDEWEDSSEVKAHNDAVAKMRERQKKKKEARERMKQNNIVPKKAGKPMFENTGNNFAARQTWGKSLVGQTFYQICPNDSRYYKTIFIRFNPFTNALQPMISNEIYGEPPDTMDKINPLILQRLLRLQQSASFRDF